SNLLNSSNPFYDTARNRSMYSNFNSESKSDSNSKTNPLKSELNNLIANNNNLNKNDTFPNQISKNRNFNLNANFVNKKKNQVPENLPFFEQINKINN